MATEIMVKMEQQLRMKTEIKLKKNSKTLQKG